MTTPSGKKIADFASVQPSQKGPAIDPLSIPFWNIVFERLTASNSLVSGTLKLNDNGLPSIKSSFEMRAGHFDVVFEC